ncbi:hypothetical protein GCM10027590_02890 [Nocardiopsis nanhaiensis]
MVDGLLEEVRGGHVHFARDTQHQPVLLVVGVEGDDIGFRPEGSTGCPLERNGRLAVKLVALLAG